MGWNWELTAGSALSGWCGWLAKFENCLVKWPLRFSTEYTSLNSYSSASSIFKLPINPRFFTFSRKSYLYLTEKIGSISKELFHLSSTRLTACTDMLCPPSCCKEAPYLRCLFCPLRYCTYDYPFFQNNKFFFSSGSILLTYEYPVIHFIFKNF